MQSLPCWALSNFALTHYSHGNCGAPKSTAKYFNNGFKVITGYQGEVDLLGAGWATTFIQTKEIVQTVGSVSRNIDSDTKQDLVISAHVEESFVR